MNSSWRWISWTMSNSTMTLSVLSLTKTISSMSSWFELLHVSWRRRVRHRPSYTQKHSAVLHRLEQGTSFSFGPPSAARLRWHDLRESMSDPRQ